MSFFSSTSGAKDAGTTTQPTRIFSGAVWAGAGRAAASAALAVNAPRLNSRRLNRFFMMFPPVFALQGYYLSARRAIDRRQPKSGPRTRAMRSGEGLQVRSFARRLPPMLRPAVSGLCGVGNGSDFQRRTARSIHLRRRFVEAGAVRHPAV